LSQTFNRLVATLDIPRLRLHDLRHTQATLLVRAGTPIKVVSERLGHASPAFTMATYQHVMPGMQAEAARTFEALLASTDFYPVEDPVESPTTSETPPKRGLSPGQMVAGVGFEPTTFGL